MKINAGIKNFPFRFIPHARWCYHEENVFIRWHQESLPGDAHGKMLFKSIGIKGLRHHRLGFQQEASFQQMMILEKKFTRRQRRRQATYAHPIHSIKHSSLGK